MTIPVLTFFNNKGGVGKTSLAYHISWMLSELGHRVLVCDLDPQANLTAAFLAEEELETLWVDQPIEGSADTIFRCLQPLTQVGDIRHPQPRAISDRIHLMPGDLALAGFEDTLSGEWSAAMGSTQNSLFRPFRILSSFWQIAQMGAEACKAELILFDVGPNLGAINRSALLSSDFVLVPLGADLFSIQGLRNLGPTVATWRQEWRKRLENWSAQAFGLPGGTMRPLGYVVQQHSVRLDRPVKAYDKWVNKIPAVYREYVLQEVPQQPNMTPASDNECLATLKHFRSLVPMGQESRKPIFKLNAADGAIGNHVYAVKQAFTDFQALTDKILSRMGLPGREIYARAAP
jgi:cellulose biosynthesis protein BcsQ